MKDPRRLEEHNFQPIRTQARFRKPMDERPEHLPTCIKGKHSYSKKKAEGVRLYLMHEQKVKFLRIYKCPKCPYWHLTHQP